MHVSYCFATAACIQQCYTGLIGGHRYSPRKSQRGCHHELSHDALSASVHCSSTQGVSLDYEGQQTVKGSKNSKSYTYIIIIHVCPQGYRVDITVK